MATIISENPNVLSSGLSAFRDCALSASLNYRHMDTDWIVEGLKQPGKTRVGLAKALRRSPSVITALLDGKRQLKVSEINRIAEYLGVTSPLSSGDHALSERSEDVKIVPLRIVGEVAAGVFADPAGDKFEPELYQVPSDPRFDAESQYLLRVRGSSVNRKAQPGSLIRCLTVYAAPRPPQHGDYVVVERKRADGTIECTAKLLKRSIDGSFQLWPDSDDPRFQDPVDLDARDGDEVTIVAFILDFINPATRL